MRRILPLLVAAVATAGCEPTVPSLHPLGSREQLLVDSALAGHWLSDEDPRVLLELQPFPGSPWMALAFYSEDCEADEEEAEYWVAETRIDGESFAILTLGDGDLGFAVPVYEFLHLSLEADSLSYRGMDDGWLMAHLNERLGDLDIIRRETVRSKLFGDSPRVRPSWVLSASTPELRRFFHRHLETDGAYSDPESMVRVEADKAIAMRTAWGCEGEADA